MTPKEQTPRIWTVFFMMLCSITIMLLFSILLTGIWMGFLLFQGQELDNIEKTLLQDSNYFILSLIFTQLAILSVTLCGAFLSPTPLKERLALRSVSLPFWHWPILILGSIGSGSLISPFVFEHSEYAQMMANMLAEQSIGYGLLIMLFGSVLPGVGEELLCRGYIQSRLLQRWTPILAISVSGFFFALLHMELLYILLTFPIGLWLGWVQYRYQSTIPTIVCHFFNNLFSFGLMVFLPRFEIDIDWQSGLLFNGVFVLFFILGIVLVAKTTRSHAHLQQQDENRFSDGG
ncbi:MAG: type II CAAX endopeptidase family protein [Myxococcota bacterium]|nr:type II CAAX endopeptidase family protein [Myxococcota bacterium]